MKKLFVIALAFSIVTSIFAVAQDTKGSSTASAPAASDKMPKAPLKSIKGTVKQDGEKITFVSDKDSKSWDVMNPETLKDHVGHHVKVSAHVYADKNSIHVMSVNMLKPSAM